jgi:hypothetical protein
MERHNCGVDKIYSLIPQLKKPMLRKAKHHTRHRKINIKMLSGMVEPTGDPTTLKKEERAMRPTPEVVRKWSSNLKCAKQDRICKKFK